MTDNPYKGDESYQVEEAATFFGRDAAVRAVADRIVSSSFTLLHGPSGAGRTSLLNAGVIPQLEAWGWSPARVRLGDDPVREIRLSMAQQLLPSPDDESAAIRRARTALAASNERATLGDLIHRYDRLERHDSRRRRLIAPHVTSSTGRLVRPFFCRLLQSGQDLTWYEDHLRALHAGAASNATLDVDECTPSDNLVEQLSGAPLQEAYAELLKQLDTAEGSLWSFLERWHRLWTSRHRRYGLVLVLDQFEELFTHFVGIPKNTETPSWRARVAFLEALEEVAGNIAHEDARGGDTLQTPARVVVRFLISVRDEYVAQLDPIRRFAVGLDASAYHLTGLSQEDAVAAMVEPAKRLGFGYAPDVIDEIVRSLASEDGSVQPLLLQIVCGRLWSTRWSRSQSAEKAQDGDSMARRIEREDYAALGGVRGLLHGDLTEFIDAIDHSDRFESLEILEMLVTPSGVRTIVEWTALVESPLTDPARRRRLLGQLQAHHFVRIESRFGSRFVELAHEFLITPVLDAIRRTFVDDNYRRLRQARAALHRCMDSDFRADVRMLLSSSELQVLHSNRKHIAWSPAAIEVMLRSAVARCETHADREVVRHWADAARDAGSSPEGMACEYLDSPEGTCQLASIRALASIGSERSVAEITRVAVELETVLGVHAADELVRLPRDAQHVAITDLQRRLGHAGSAWKAIALLARLRNAGAEVTLPWWPLTDRIRLAVYTLIHQFRRTAPYD